MHGTLREPLVDHLRQIGLLPAGDKLSADVVGAAAAEFIRWACLRNEDERERVIDMVLALSENNHRNEWRYRLRNYDSGKGWPPNVFGPPPEHPENRIPTDILAEWRRARRTA